jgi:hypothetical protein
VWPHAAIEIHKTSSSIFNRCQLNWEKPASSKLLSRTSALVANNTQYEERDAIHNCVYVFKLPHLFLNIKVFGRSLLKLSKHTIFRNKCCSEWQQNRRKEKMVKMPEKMSQINRIDHVRWRRWDGRHQLHPWHMGRWMQNTLIVFDIGMDCSTFTERLFECSRIVCFILEKPCYIFLCLYKR